MKVAISKIPTRIGLGLAATACWLGVNANSVAGAVFLADGAKAGEVTSDSAVVWARLTVNPERNVNGFPFVEVKPENLPPMQFPAGLSDYEKNALIVSRPIPEKPQLGGHRLDEMEGAVPGVAGEAAVVYWPDGDETGRRATSRRPVDPAADFTTQFRLSDLSPGTHYRYRVEGFEPGASRPSTHYDGRFTTAPRPDQAARVSFTLATCQDYPRRDDPSNGHRIYDVMLRLAPDFFVHAGDLEYLDKPTPLATTLRLAKFKYNRIMAMPFQRAFYGQVSNYFMKDDHDTLKDDCWPGETYGDITWAEGVALFKAEVPTGDLPYRTVRWGRDLQIWLVEGREYRSPNTMPDGPDKTIWGAAQKQWFFDTVRASDATFQILISPTPLLGPDRDSKGDNHANKAFAHEGAELRSFVAARKNMIVLTGDRHWQYASVDPETGLREFSCGASSDAHAGGFSEADRTPAHRFLRIKGGFLSVVVDRDSGGARMTLRHYGTDGVVYHEEVIRSDRRAFSP